MKKFRELADLMEIKYQVSQEELRKVTAQEAKIRDQIQRVDSYSNTDNGLKSVQMNSIGVDLAWRAWANRSKSTLNTELAQVLAKKELLLQSARRDFGKVLVSNSLSDTEIAEAAQLRQKRNLSQIQERLNLETPDSPQ